MAEVEKGPLDKLIDWLNGWKASFRQMRKQFGWPAAALITLSSAVGFVWWKWDEIAKRPGIEWALERFQQKPLPTAPAGRLTIAVAHLDNDKDQEQKEGPPRRPPYA